MLDHRTHLRLGAITAALIAHRMIVRRLLLRQVACMSGVLSNHFVLAAIGRVSPYSSLLSMQQVGQRRGVVHVGGARHYRVNQLAAAVRAEPRFIMPKYHEFAFFV